MTPINDVLQKTQFVMDAEGHTTAAMLDIQSWETLLDWLEEFEDVQLARERLQSWPSKQGWTRWEDSDREAKSA